jgi:uncharacterized membrane protein
VSCSAPSACCKCFGSSKWMLQVFKPDVVGDYVLIVVQTCCHSSKCLFQVCHVVFRLRVCKCFGSSKWMLQVFKPDVVGDYVSIVVQTCCRSSKCLFQVCHVVFCLRGASVLVVRNGCFKCLNQMLQETTFQ